MKLYVAGEIPRIPASVIALSGELYRYLADAGAAPVQQSRLVNSPSVAAAKAAFGEDPHLRLLMDNGSGAQGPGSIGATWELGYGSWPPKAARVARYWLRDGGALGSKPARPGSAGYTADPSARPAKTLPGDGAEDAWKAQPPYNWAPIAAGKGLGFITEPLGRHVVVGGRAASTSISSPPPGTPTCR